MRIDSRMRNILDNWLNDASFRYSLKRKRDIIPMLLEERIWLFRN